MKIVITGGNGFIARILVRRLLQTGRLVGPSGQLEPIERILLVDQVLAVPAGPINGVIAAATCDVANREELFEAMGDDFDTVFHFATVMSGVAERDLDLGYRINLDATRHVLDACRAAKRAVRFMFASTIGVFGGPNMPRVVRDDSPLRPPTSYGAAKAMGELLVNDYTRKGYVDGRCGRFATVIIRPGPIGQGAGAFVSGLFKELLAGRPYSAPVPLDVEIAIAGYNSCVAGLIHMVNLAGTLIGADRAVNFPNLTCTVSDMVNTLRAVVGAAHPLGELTIQTDPEIERIVRSWPVGMDWSRARRLSFPEPESLVAIVKSYIGDFLEHSPQTRTSITHFDHFGLEN